MFTLHSIRLVAATPVLIKCAKGHDLSLDVGEQAYVTAGSFYTRFISLLTQDSKIKFTSYAIDQIIALTGLIGMAFGTGKTYTSIELFFACYDKYGVFMSGGSHVSVTMTAGFLSWNTINTQTNQDTEIECEIFALDPDVGTTLPITVATGVSLPTTVPADDTRFSMKSATIGGISLTCIQSININANRTIEFRRCGSDIYSKSLRSSPVKPTIAINVQDPQALSAAKIPFKRKVCAHANTSIFLRKRFDSQVDIGYELDATTVHIKLTAAGVARCGNHQSSVPDPGNTSLTLTTIDDGTNAPIVVTTGVAIA